MTSNLPLVKASKMLHIRSEHRTNGTNTSFTIDLNQPLAITDLNESIFLSLVSAIIPHTWYNITTKNQKFEVVYENKTTPTTIDTKNITIPVGTYDSNTFISELATQLSANKPANDNASSYNIVLENTTKHVKISFNSTVWKFKTLTFLDDLYKNFSLQNKNPINGVVVQGTDQSDFLINGFFNLTLVNELRVVINNINTQEVYNNFSRGNQCILSNILVNTAPNSFIYHYPSYRNSVQVVDATINTLQISLTDTEGNIVDLQNVPWSLCIRADYRKTMDNSVNKVGNLTSLFKK
jgi:hypothetical protein